MKDKELSRVLEKLFPIIPKEINLKELKDKPVVFRREKLLSCEKDEDKT